MPKLITTPVAGPVNVQQASPQTFGAGIGQQLQGAGQAVSQLAQIPAAYSEMSARRKAAEASLRIQDEAGALLLDNDLENREENFEKVKTRISNEFRKGVGSTGIFDAQISVAAGRIGNNLRQRTRVAQVETALNDMSETLKIYADQGARTNDPSERALYQIQADLAIERGVESGLLGPVQVDALRKQYREAETGGLLRRLQNDDPASGLRYLESPSFAGTEEERQVWRGHMMASMRTKVGAELTQIRRAEAADARRNRIIGERVRKGLFEKAVMGGGISPEDVLPFREVLSPTVFESMLTMASGDGTPAPSETNPNVFQNLLDAANEAGRELEMGDQSMSFSEANFAAWSTGQITQSDYLRLQSVVEDKSIKEPLKLIHDGIAGSMFAGPAAQFKAVEAQQDYMDWHRSQREANDGRAPGLQEIQDYSMALIRSAQMTNLDGSKITQLKPLFAVYEQDGKTLNFQATAEATRAEFAAGRISEEKLAEQIRVMRIMRDAGGSN